MRRLGVALTIVLAACAAAMTAGGAVTDRSNTGRTPRDAALHFLVPGRSFRIVGTEAAGRFAVVRFSGAVMEGDSNWHDDLLIERFPFGWQVVDTVSDACLPERGANRAELKALVGRYVPARRAPNAAPCAESVDRGPARDVVTVRSINRDWFAIPSVRVSRDYALVNWAFPGGGETIFARRGAGWRRVAGGGGVSSAAELIRYGVPLRDACAIVSPSMSDRLPCK